MKLIRLSVLAALCQILIFQNTLLAKTIEVEFLTDKSYRPFSYVENSEVLGMYPDIIRAAFALMPEYKLKLTAMDWTSAKKGVENGDALGLVGVLVRGQNIQKIYPFSFPIGKESVVTICHHEVLDSSQKQWPVDYKGLLVGNIEGFNGWLNYQVRSENETQGINFLEVPNTKIAFDMVSNARLDCSLFDEVAFYDSLEKPTDTKSVKKSKHRQPEIGSHIFSRPIHIGYSRKAFESEAFSYAFDFQHALDMAIYTLEESGQLKLIRQKYTPIALSPF